MPRKFNFEDQIFSEKSVINELAPIVILTLCGEHEGLSATQIQDLVQERFSSISKDLTLLPPSFIYPLMQALVDANLLHRNDEKIYSLTKNGRSQVNAARLSLKKIYSVI